MPISISGLFPWTAQRLVKYVFRDTFVGFEIHKEDGYYLVYLHEPDQEIMDDFLDYWDRNCFKVKLVNKDQKQLIEDNLRSTK